jgi:hypothetical protein
VNADGAFFVERHGGSPVWRMDRNILRRKAGAALRRPAAAWT